MIFHKQSSVEFNCNTVFGGTSQSTDQLTRTAGPPGPPFVTDLLRIRTAEILIWYFDRSGSTKVFLVTDDCTLTTQLIMNIRFASMFCFLLF